MQRHALLWAVLLYTGKLSAQTLRYSIAAPYIGLNAYSSRHTDVFSFTGNQAALAQQKKASFGVYGERRFMLAATSVYKAVVALPTQLGNFGLQVNHAGFNNFSENAIGLAYARNLDKKVAVGVQFNYYGYNIPIYGKAATVNVEAGALFHFSNKLHGGIHVYNPFAAPLSKVAGEKLAAVYKIGMGYEASDQFLLSAEIIKEEDKPTSVTAGVQYQLMERFFVRTGFVSSTSTVFAGAGVGWKNWRLHLTGSYHPQLGLSPGLLFIIGFNPKQDA